MANGESMFLKTVRDAHMKIKEQSANVNIFDLTRASRGEGRGNPGGSRLGLGTPESRSEKRKAFIDRTQPLDRLTSTSRQFKKRLF